MSEFDPDFSIIDGDFRVGDFLVRPLLKVVCPLPGRVGGETDDRRLPDKAMAVLLLLAENPREVCERDYLLDEVWGVERESYDRVLDNAIREIRRAFGDDARNPEYVQTIAKTGYRLIAEVEVGYARGLQSASPAAPTEPGSAGEGEGDDDVSADPAGESVEDVKEEAEAPAPPEETPPHAASESRRGPAEEGVDTSGHTAPRRDRRKPTLALLLVLLVLVAAAASWTWTQSRDLLLLDVELAGEGSNPDLFVAGDVAECFERAVDEHPCGEESLLAMRSSFLQPGLRVPLRISRRSDGEADHLESTFDLSEVEPQTTLPGGKVIVGLAEHDALDTGLERLVHTTIERLDGIICEETAFPDAARACHCVASQRSWAFPESPQPALDHLETAVRLDPGRLDALDDLVRLYLWSGYRDRAEVQISRGLEQIEDPTSEEALALLRRMAQLHRDHDEEGRLLDALVEGHPERAKWRLAQALFSLDHRHDCVAALAQFDDLVDLFPDDGNFPAIRAGVRHFCGESRRGYTELKKLIRSGATDQIGHHVRLANIASFLGHYDEARRLVKSVFVVVPESTQIRSLLGRIEMAAGAHRTADLWFHRSTEAAGVPRQMEMGKAGRAHNALVAGRPEAALEIVATIDPSALMMDLYPGYLRGRAHLALGDPATAREIYEGLVDLHQPRRSRFQIEFVLELQARILHAEGRHDEALETLDRCLEGVPFDRSRPLFLRAQIAYESGRTAQAEEAFERLLELNPFHGRALCLAAELHEERGELARARTMYRRGLSSIDEPGESTYGRRCMERSEALGPGDL